ncbi:MAG TPA: D-alanine--D-alanine ligase family protein [Actinomycetota bacterium]|nr:D-alanine--D-alanine ligase family protein [Actinomycetota bacterium]
MSGRRRIAVIFGGRSAEHEISCISARSVIDALDPARFDVVPVGITKDGTWHLMSGPPALPSETGRMPQVTPGAGAGARVALAGEGAARELVAVDGSRAPIDVVLPVLHGPMGEDGAVQGMFELADVPYVGAGVLGSAIGMDKAIQKVLFAAAGLPVGPWQPVREPEWREDPEGVSARIAALGFPVFVKPATLGSSVGISKVHEPGEVDRAMDEAFRFARKVVVEHGFEGVREIECAVLGNDDPVASVCGEVVPTGHEFYDYASKYLDERGARLDVPAGIDADVQARVQRMSVAAFQAIECWGMARVDFFLRGEEVFVNEINTIPGFTEISMYPKLWQASGLTYGELIERLIDLATERRDAEREKLTVVPELETPSEGRPGIR